MSKFKILVVSLLLVSVVFFAFYMVEESSAKSLDEILIEKDDFDKINSMTVFNHEKMINSEFHEENQDLIKFEEILKKAELKRDWNLSDSSINYTIGVNASFGVNFLILISKDGIVKIDNEDKEYKFTNNELFNELLTIIQKTPEQNF